MTREECVWDAPSYIQHVPSLRHRIPLRLQSTMLKTFLRSTLQIIDVSWKHLIQELTFMRELGDKDPQRVLEIYRALDNIRNACYTSDESLAM